MISIAAAMRSTITTFQLRSFELARGSVAHVVRGFTKFSLKFRFQHSHEYSIERGEEENGSRCFGTKSKVKLAATNHRYLSRACCVEKKAQSKTNSTRSAQPKRSQQHVKVLNSMQISSLFFCCCPIVVFWSELELGEHISPASSCALDRCQSRESRVKMCSMRSNKRVHRTDVNFLSSPPQCMSTLSCAWLAGFWM